MKCVKIHYHKAVDRNATYINVISMSADYLHTCLIEPQPLGHQQLLFTATWHSLLFTVDGSLDVKRTTMASDVSYPRAL
jgi:hypothetical protein